MNAWKILLALFVLTLHCALSSAAFVTVDMSSQANFAWGAAINDPDSTTVVRLPGAPVGNVTLGGVQFNIKSNASGLQAWDANIAAGGGSAVETLTIPVSTAAVSEVYTLINTEWGQNGPASYAKITFNATGGLSYTKTLVGGVDIRDWNPSTWTTTLTAPTSVNVFHIAVDGYGYPGQLDMQAISLPSTFLGQTLTSIVLTDNGGPSFQRTVLDGLTLVVPEPSSAVMLAALPAGLLVRRRTP